MTMNGRTTISRRALLAGCPLGAGALLGWTSRASAAGTPFPALNGSPEESAVDESLWKNVQAQFDLDTNRIQSNLAAAVYNAPPRPVLAALFRANQYVGSMPRANRPQLFGDPVREKLRRRLARKLGVKANEIALTRGTTEALNIVIAGMPLQSGDEVITTDLDYESLKDAWKIRGLRDGVQMKEVSLPHPPASPESVIKALETAFTPRTKVLMICHVMDYTGQILPLREICEMAHSKGVRVLVDGALAFGVIPVNLSELNCDYYGTSLHKGMYAPAGTGLLYIREGLSEEVLPLFGVAEPHSADMRKYEEIGTAPLGPLSSVNAALDFHERIGTERIQARLHSLTKQWLEILAESPNVVLHTSLDPDQSCAIACAQIGSADHRKVWYHLYNEYGISAYYCNEPFAGIVVRFHIHTLRSEVEQCAIVLRDIADRGLPG